MRLIIILKAMKIIYSMYRAGESLYTEHAASGLPNPTRFEGEVRFIQAQDRQVKIIVGLRFASANITFHK